MTAYRRLVGKLIHLIITRPNLSYSVHVLAQFMTAPHSVHRHAALKLVRYLSRTGSQSLHFSSKANLVLIAYCDADWAGCETTRLSLTGCCITFGGTLVSWKCKKQNSVSRFLAEA